ncbi:MAG TPA: hypothetical protein VFY84_21235, partial [Jiangellales bacterium]|nr:hypothetical protein [Jiangellales bacterium]
VRLGVRPASRVDRRDRWVPPAGVLVVACLWALGSAVVGAVVGAAALIAVAGHPPTWYPLSVLTAGGVALISTVGGLLLAGIRWLRWKLLAIGTTAVIVAGLMTVTVLAGYPAPWAVSGHGCPLCSRSHPAGGV